MSLLRFTDRIYKEKDYLTRNKAFHLFIFNVASVLLGMFVNSYIWLTKGYFLRPGFSIMMIASLLSLIFLVRKKFEIALKIVLVASVVSVSVGWFFGFSKGAVALDESNRNIVLSIFIMIFLYFTNVKQTILIALYCLFLIFVEEFYREQDNNMIHIADRIALFIMYSIIAIIAVRTLHGSVKEKNELIQEIHHRVRNNLQVLSGLVEMHSGSDKGNLQSILSDFQDRILAISEVHNYLYKSENYFDIDFAEVIDGIIKNLSDKLGKRTVNIENSTEQVYLRIESALPCAMIFSELLSNSLKHAFPAEKGTVKVRFQKEGNKYRLRITDDGSGISDSKVWQKPKTSGFTLIQILTKQIKGSFEIFSGSGSTAILEFNA
ncbi:sensor histidine kinase [Leptospira yasudae]|uniref:histidine kinase n=1 Tax=Leptospira yasudae TaxID=2202201 RepID=A0A6N4QJU5_9LEPT|nr:sensor histidine kinase [Leptospira yasudae]TGL80015.1 sensor histidine kinase [Leptospira yasudae]TGL80204.1 sensor histidine kinase [Leptospira yasudae]TGL81099.1 sensor histidine kinase [Leptospira yasudae]